MWDLFRLIFGLIIDLFRSRAALEAELLVLKQQIIVLRRGKPNRMSFLAVDRLILGWVCRLFHLRHILKCYMEYYNAVRTHLSLGKDAPVRRIIQRTGRIQGRPVLGGLHHRYVRI
jgi:hypothetical protein